MVPDQKYGQPLDGATIIQAGKILLSGLGFTPGDGFLVLEIQIKIIRDGYNRGDGQKIPCFDPE